MSITLEERLLIDRYLDGTLSGIELQKFMERLDADEMFRDSVSIQNLLVEGIIRSADKQLQHDLLQTISYKKPLVPLGLKLILTFLVLTSGGIIFWNYIGPDPSGGKKHPISFSWFSRSGDTKVEPEKETSKSEKRREDGSDQGKSTKQEGSGQQDQSSQYSSEEDQDSLQRSDEEVTNNELVVKQDQLLISQRLIIREDSSLKTSTAKKKKEKESSLSQEVAAKLNPAAGLEIKEKDSAENSSLIVEFWISPINYRGYKLVRNKLIVFGLEEPDAVVLFRQDEKLYLHYFDNYFILEPTEEFTSYQQVKDKEFSSRLDK